MSEYKKCNETQHEWTRLSIDDSEFHILRLTYHCLHCGATSEMEGDVRTDDGRFIEWVLTDE